MNAADGPSPASAHVSEERLWQLLMDVASYGATGNGGVNRQALSAEDTAAKQHVVQWAAARGFSTFQDDIGNLFVRRDGGHLGEGTHHLARVLAGCAGASVLAAGDGD